MALLPVIGLFLLVKVPMWANDAKLDSLIGRFESYPLPPKTYWADKGAEGSIALRGNGNHCDYRARFMLSTELSVDELTDYYDQADIAGVETGRPNVTVWTRQPSKRAAYSSRTVIVELNDGTGAGLDLRCH
ncbi:MULTISPECIES: hypothetical protein [Streptosporangium]|uniref:Uncharacterized protein n=1 Tax=Streptosporangium brasiliense TaxID=47480 RepID=A0ABT9R4J9_9ACTN|nr:hypothetical protein [Streptosporangium brasiliense]MDP9863350.1 hypothetical protein [Streptosporangium brasiliense]